MDLQEFTLEVQKNRISLSDQAPCHNPVLFVRADDPSPSHASELIRIYGSGGHMQLVFLIKWTKLNGRKVSGIVEVWAEDAGANDRLIQTEVIANLSRISFKNPATDSYRRSFPHPLKLLLPRQSRSPDLKYVGVRYFQDETPMTS